MIRWAVRRGLSMPEQITIQYCNKGAVNRMAHGASPTGKGPWSCSGAELSQDMSPNIPRPNFPRAPGPCRRSVQRGARSSVFGVLGNPCRRAALPDLPSTRSPAGASARPSCLAPGRTRSTSRTVTSAVGISPANNRGDATTRRSRVLRGARRARARRAKVPLSWPAVLFGPSSRLECATARHDDHERAQRMRLFGPSPSGIPGRPGLSVTRIDPEAPSAVHGREPGP